MFSKFIYKLIIFVVFIGPITSIQAATIEYVGANYTFATAPYTTAMNVTGTITTSSPLLPNLNYERPANITSFSFSDGVRTIDNTNGYLVFFVRTDAGGNITGIFAPKVLLGTQAPTSGEVRETINVLSSLDRTTNETTCVNSSCESGHETLTSILAQSSVAGVFTTTLDNISIPESIPTLSEWGVIVLILLLGSVMIRRKVYR